jgi:hypothetical protein
MLTHIVIKDLVIVSALELDLAAGMTALTGETGAGKSILIDALGLALGEKADAGMIRTGCDRAEVSAGFDLAAAPMHATGSRAGAGRRRRMPDPPRAGAQGRARAFINGQSASGGQLRALGDLLVDIHGQHAHQSLLRPAPSARCSTPTAAIRPDHARWRTCTAATANSTPAGANSPRPATSAPSASICCAIRSRNSTIWPSPTANSTNSTRAAPARQPGQLQGTAGALVDLLYDGDIGEGAGALRDQLGHAASELAGLPTSTRA